MNITRPLATALHRFLLGTMFLAASASHADFALTPALAVPAPAQSNLVDMAWQGQRLFVAGERGLIAYSVDGGAGWTQASVPVSATLTAITFTPGGTGFAVGHGGVILRSANGDTWETVFTGDRASAQFLAWAEARVAALEAELAALEAADDPDPDALEETEYAIEDAMFAVDDARTALETGPADPFLDVKFLDDRTGVAVGAYGMLYRTEDGGDSWQLAIDDIDNSERFHLYSIAVDPGGRLHISGEAGLLFYSDDRGLSWSRAYDVYDGSLFSLVVAGDDLYAIGLRGNVFRSRDGGVSWASVTLEGSGSLYNGVVTDSGALIFVGTGGRLVFSDDDGATFAEHTHPSRSALADVAVQGGRLLLAGMSGFLVVDLEDYDGD